MELVEKALENAKKSISAEEQALHRAIAAGRGKAIITAHEQEMLDQFPEGERVAVLVFVRWCQGQKFQGGAVAKARAKAAFIQAFRIAQAIYGPSEEQQEARSKLILP